MSKRYKDKPKIYVNDKRYFQKDDISLGVVRAYAVYVPAEKEKVEA